MLAYFKWISPRESSVLPLRRPRSISSTTTILDHEECVHGTMKKNNSS